MSPSVSVIVPTYNRAALLAEALASIQQQTHPCTEIIVVDDGSTDETAATMKFPPPGVRYVQQTNGGPAVARSTGMRLATSEFVALLDSDDLWAPERLARQLSMLQAYPELDVIFGLEAKFTADAKSEEIEVRDKSVLAALHTTKGPLADPFGLLLTENYIPTSSVLVRRAWLEKVGFMDRAVQPAEDHDLWFKLAVAGCKFGFVNAVLCHRRMHGGNLVNQWTRLAIAGAKVLARYRDHSPQHRAWGRRRLELLCYDIGSRLLSERKYAQAWPYLRESQAKGRARLARPAKLALAWLGGGWRNPRAPLFS